MQICASATASVVPIESATTCPGNWSASVVLTAYFIFHARTYSTLNVEGKSLSSGIPNHSGIVSLSKIRKSGWCQWVFSTERTEHAIHVELHLVLAPVQAVDVVIVGQPPRGFPDAAHAPVLLLLWACRKTCRFMLYLCSKPLALPPISNTSISVTQPGVSSCWNQNELDPPEFIGLALTS